MSEYIMSGYTALDAYYYIREKNYWILPIVLHQDVRIPSKNEIENLLQESWLKHNSIEVLLSNNTQYRNTNKVQQSCFTRNKKGVVTRISCRDTLTQLDGLAVVSPAFLLAQFASRMDFLSLYILALEFGGTYSVNPHTGLLFSDRRKLLSSRLLNGIVIKLQETCWPGISKLKKVAKNFCEGSASPMETELYTKLSLSTRDGGLGISGLTINSKIALSNEAKKIAGQPYVIVDMLHQQSKVVLEYDSRSYHGRVEQSQKDKQRRDALQKDGYKCYSVVPRQIAHPFVFNACMKPVVESIKGRWRIRSKGFSYSQRLMFDKFAKIRRENMEKAKKFYGFLDS